MAYAYQIPSPIISSEIPTLKIGVTKVWTQKNVVTWMIYLVFWQHFYGLLTKRQSNFIWAYKNTYCNLWLSVYFASIFIFQIFSSTSRHLLKVNFDDFNSLDYAMLHDGSLVLISNVFLNIYPWLRETR